MKSYSKYILSLFAALVFASCMSGEWDEPSLTESPYGNNSLTESNLISISDLKTRYANTIDGGMMEEVKEPMQVKGVVTANDIQGNIYNEVAIDDGTGAFVICISQGGLFGYLPVGQEILVELKGLYIGGYGMQGEIGMPYTNASGRTYVSRMSRMVWNEHFRLIGNSDPSRVVPEEFNIQMLKDKQYMTENCGKLMVLRGVELADADGKAVFAPSDGSVTLVANSANRALKGHNASDIVVRTSSYADFANSVMPTGRVDITGLFTRFNNTWQILLRTIDDIQPSKQ